MTMDDIVDWVMEHRAGMAFNGYSRDKITIQLVEGCQNGTCCITVDEKDKITGVCCGTKNASNKQFYVNDILTTDSSAIREMVKTFLQLFPDYTITGRHRSGRSRKFNNPIKLEQRL